MKSEVTRTPPPDVAGAVARLGRRIRVERIRRGLTQRDLADRMGVTRFSVMRLENGNPGVSMGMHAGALWALGLLGPLAEIGNPHFDEEGATDPRPVAGAPQERPARSADRRRHEG